MSHHQYAAISDDEVLRRLRSGETGMYQVFMDRYHRRVFSMLRGILHNDAEAEDAAQDAHLRALTRLDQFDGRSSFYTWLARIAINEALARMRSASRHTVLAVSDDNRGLTLVSGHRNPEQQAFDTEVERAFERAIESLPEAYRMVFRLRAIDEASTAETADRLSISDQCVKTRLQRARALLRRKLCEPMRIDRRRSGMRPVRGLEKQRQAARLEDQKQAA
jgi:RNA polymerase sigma-70 factor (ECF subfamily)